MNQELRDKIIALVPQTACEFGCDGNGTYSDNDMDGEQVAAQCEYCYVVRFPTVDSLYQLVVESQIKELKRLQSSYDSEIGWDIGDRLTQLQSLKEERS